MVFVVPNKIPLALAFDDVLLVPHYSEIDSRSDVDLSSVISPNVKLKIPLISTKMDNVTGVEMAVTLGKLGGLGILPRFDSPEKQAQDVSRVSKENVATAAAVGVKDGFIKRAEMLISAGATILDVDVAHGHMLKTLEATKTLKQKFGKKITIMAGIAATYESAVDLYKSGADCLLVGVGGSPICTTRIQTGFGLPTLASLFEVARAAKKFKKTFAPDAGVRNSGDIVKSLAAGASAIVGGFIFAGTDEAPGELIEVNGQKFKRYNGSSSFSEKTKHVELYADDKNKNYTIQIEGVESLVPYKGSVVSVVESLLAGVRSGLSYAGANNIPELWKKAEFIQITQAGIRESNVHDVVVAR